MTLHGIGWSIRGWLDALRSSISRTHCANFESNLQAEGEIGACKGQCAGKRAQSCLSLNGSHHPLRFRSRPPKHTNARFVFAPKSGRRDAHPNRQNVRCCNSLKFCAFIGMAVVATGALALSSSRGGCKFGNAAQLRIPTPAALPFVGRPRTGTKFPLLVRANGGNQDDPNVDWDNAWKKYKTSNGNGGPRSNVSTKPPT